MAFAVDVAVSPTVGPDGVTHMMLQLWSDGRITALGGAGIPKQSPMDNIVPRYPTAGGWSAPRYNGFLSPTSGIPSGEIAKKICVLPTGGWSDPTDIQGYVLDAWGQVIPFGTLTLALFGTAPGVGYWGPAFEFGGGQNIARDLCISNRAAGQMWAYVMDMSGGYWPKGVGGTPPAIASGPYWQGTDIARSLTLDPNFDSIRGGIQGPYGWVLDGNGGMHRVSVNVADPWLSETTHGGAYWSGWDIARDMIFNFGTKVGQIMDGWGGCFFMGSNHPEFGPQGQGPSAPGFPYTKGADIWVSLQWPLVSTPKFVSMNRDGAAIQWDLQVNPVNTITTPTTITNTSRPAFAFKYGPWVDPKPGALSQIVCYLYERSTRNAPNFVPEQAVGAIWNYWESGITGWDPQNAVRTLPPATEFLINNQVLEDLPNGSQYNLFMLTVSTEGLTSAWTELAFSTAYAGQGAPSLTATGQPDNADGPRVALLASGGGSGSLYEYQFSDDSLTWDTTVLGGEAVTSGTIYDYEALPGKKRWYRVFKYTPSPFLRTAPSSPPDMVQMAQPAAGVPWRFIKIGTSPLEVVVLHAAGWRKKFRQPQEVHDPPGTSRASITSAGYRGIDGTLLAWVATKADHDELADVFTTPRVLLLQGQGEQWYVWPGEVEAEWKRAQKMATGPDAIYAARFFYEFTIPLTEVERPGIL